MLDAVCTRAQNDRAKSLYESRAILSENDEICGDFYHKVNQFAARYLTNSLCYDMKTER